MRLDKLETLPTALKGYLKGSKHSVASLNEWIYFSSEQYVGRTSVRRVRAYI
jgi:hypothetical protein